MSEEEIEIVKDTIKIRKQRVPIFSIPRLKGKIKKIQTELNKVKADSTQKSTNKVISQSLNNLNVKIT